VCVLCVWGYLLKVYDFMLENACFRMTVCIFCVRECARLYSVYCVCAWLCVSHRFVSIACC
jgi:hypothetical protein